MSLPGPQGSCLQAHATGVGKVLLSGLEDEQLHAWLGSHVLETYTPHTITSPAGLLKELTRIRMAGYAVDREERLLGASCVAVGVHNHRGAIAAAMSVAAATARFKKKEQAMALEQLKIAAAELSAALAGCGNSRLGLGA